VNKKYAFGRPASKSVVCFYCHRRQGVPIVSELTLESSRAQAAHGAWTPGAPTARRWRRDEKGFPICIACQWKSEKAAEERRINEERLSKLFAQKAALEAAERAEIEAEWDAARRVYTKQEDAAVKATEVYRGVWRNGSTGGFPNERKY